MRLNSDEGKTPPAGFLTRLRRDKRGNTMVMMALAMLPISALAGSAVDMGRLYVVKVRLQQACDAGVLAGRKFMDEGANTGLGTKAEQNARTFFQNNFKEGWLDTKNVGFTPSKTSANRVAGVATTTVPMTVMKMFALPDANLQVTCEARFDVADTDVMFVLDVTGSMACLPTDSDTTCRNYAGDDANQKTYTRPTNSADDVTAGYAGTTGWRVVEKSGSRISLLRQAVEDFWTTMNATKQANTRVRYGFVPYTSTVNAGAAIMAMNRAYMIGATAGETWDYQTRHPTADLFIQEVANTRAYNGKSQSDCEVKQISRSQPFPNFNLATGQAQRVVQRWYTTTRGGATLSPAQCGTATEDVGPVWTYERFGWDVSSYISSASVQDPTKVRTSNVSWLGCIEERRTTPKTLSFNSASLPADLDPDLVPSSRDTRWRPLWPETAYWRLNSARNDWTTGTFSENGDPSPTRAIRLADDAGLSGGQISCNKPIQRLAEMKTLGEVSRYVRAPDFVPIGGTYHDTGMIWALRLLSRNGVFAPDNAAPANRSPAKRVIVFLTDGDMAPNQLLYGMYGMEYYDQRVAGGDTANLKAYHNARFLALCAKAEQMGIDVWTVALGTGKTTELTQCASVDDQALAPDPKDPSALSTAFKKIAKAVANLRVSQ